MAAKSTMAGQVVGARPGSGRTAEQIIAAAATRQHGIVARRQLLGAGIAPGVVDRRIKTGQLQRIYSGVYRVGSVQVPGAREMAAVLACGRDAVVSHRSAGALWQLLGKEYGRAPVHVIVPSHTHVRAGVKVHRIRTLQSDETACLDGIPVTTATRTLYDLAGSVRPRELERALAEALALRLTTPAKLEKLLAEHPHGPGSRALRALLDAGTPAFTRSEAEERFLALIRAAQLQAPEVNVRVEGYEVDFHWRAARLVVEIDGFRFHSSARSFERDRKRDAVLAVAGLEVVRVTWRQIEREPFVVVARVAQLLMRRPHRT